MQRANEVAPPNAAGLQPEIRTSRGRQIDMIGALTGGSVIMPLMTFAGMIGRSIGFGIVDGACDAIADRSPRSRKASCKAGREQQARDEQENRS